MKFQGGDILVRKIKNSDIPTIWISQRLIMSVCDISDELFRVTIRRRYKSSVRPCHRHHNILPDTGKSWRWAKMKGEFYYDLNRIPNRKPTCYRDLFGDANTLIESYNLTIQESLESSFDADLILFVKEKYEYYLQHYIEHTPIQRVALAKACAVLTYTVNYINDNPELKANAILKDVCAAVARKDLRYVPKHFKRLKEKIDPIINEGLMAYQVIRLPRANNANSLVYDDPTLKACAIKMRAMPQNYTNEYIIRTIQKAYKIRGKRVPGRRWFGQNVFEKQKVKILTAEGRYGKGSRKAFENTGYISMENALFAGRLMLPVSI
jgi:hypothetical protein